MEDDFFAVAVQSGLVPAEAIDELRQATTARGVAPSQMALERGLLSVAQVDIVETLRRPRDVIPGYEVLSLVGQGGMGVVYRARQLSFDRIVALKTVLVSAVAHPASLARFEQEARTIGRLLHPHIVTAYDFGKHAGRLFLAMEFVDGEDADQYLARIGPLSAFQTWGIIRQAAAGLACAAESGVTHRDIKPANLLLIPPPQGFPLPPGVPMVKVADFGLALLHEDGSDRTRLTADQSTLGSPQYMAPEQLTGSRVDQRADIYALGATAYHLLTGRTPFEGKTLPQIFALKLQSGPRPLSEVRPDLPADAVALVNDLLAIDPSRRIGDYATLLRRIDELSDANVVSPRSHSEWSLGKASTISGASATTLPSMSAVPKQPVSRLEVTLGRIAAVFLLIAGLLYLIVTNSHTPEAEWKPSGLAIPCFNGLNLKGWRILGGQWQPAQDSEGGRVLAGSGGATAFAVSGPSAANDPKCFRVVALAQLNEASAVELQSGQITSSDGERVVLRLTGQGVQFGLRRGESGPLDRVVHAQESAVSPREFYELRLERQPQAWRAAFHGQTLGAIASTGAFIPEFVLAAERPPGQAVAPAWFSDITLEELIPPSAP